MSGAVIAPERIWLEPTGIREGWTGLPERVVEGDVEYIRADLAKEVATLRAALALAVPYVERVASTSPTQRAGIERAMLASRDLQKISAAMIGGAA